MLGIWCQEDNWSKKSKKHEHIPYKIDQEASVLEEGDINELVGNCSTAWLLGLILSSCLRCDVQFSCTVLIGGFALWKFCFYLDGSHKGSCHAAVEHHSSEDEEASSPSKMVKEKLVEGSQGEQEDRATCHCQAICYWPFHKEVFTDYRKSWLQVKS